MKKNIHALMMMLVCLLGTATQSACVLSSDVAREVFNRLGTQPEERTTRYQREYGQRHNGNYSSPEVYDSQRQTGQNNKEK